MDMDIEKARFNMIEQQIKPWYVFDERLLGAMSILPRELFVAEEHRKIAYADTAIPIGNNQSMLAPRELARMIQALELKGHEKLLEIGCGSGYACALLSKLAKKIYSVDIIADFVKLTQQQVNRFKLDNVIIEEADATNGCLAHAPYDAILITCAMPKLSNRLKRSLKNNGRIVAIFGNKTTQTVNVCTVDSEGEWAYEALFPIRTKSMINAEQPNRFVF